MPLNCMATIGQVGNIDHENVNIGKAGRKRHMGWRPDCARLCYEPLRSPARRRRGQEPHRPSRPCYPVGQARSWVTRPARHNNRTDKLIVKRRNGK